MWIAVTGGLTYTNLEIDADIIAFKLSTLFNCPRSNMNVSSDVLCDGVYHCDHYEDESTCNYTATYLESGESYSIDIPRNYTRRFYYATVLQTNDTNGFRIVFQDFYIRSTNQIQIGRGTDPSDPETVITTIYGTTHCCPWDVYIESNEMWIGVIGGLTYTNLEIDADINAFDLSTLFNCPRSNMNVSSDVLCDGVYHCDYYEDESACNYTTTYLQSGESHSIDIPRCYTRRFYHATVLQTNDTNGFRMVFQDFYIRSTNQVQIGTGTDPSDPQSVITSLFGYRSSSGDVYVETNQMWMAVIGGLYDTNLFIYVDIFAIDLSTLFNCPVSNNGLSVLCDGVYQCDFYEDESACNYTATYLQSGESYSIDIPRNYTTRLYHVTVLQTNDTNGFRIVFQDFYIRSTNQIQVGTGTDPSDPETVITTIYGTTYCCPWDVYIESNEMWIGVIGGLTYTNLEIDADIVAFDLSTLFNCPRSNMNVSSDVLCDGVYHCDYYEDESACNYTTTYLQSGESHSIDIPRNYTRRFYHATVLQINDTNGFRIVFQDFYIRSTNQIQIGTGTDPSDPQSVITSLFGSRSSSDDVYVETNQMWMAVIGGLYDTNLFLDVDIFAIDLSTLFNCPVSNNGLSVLCDGVYQCDFYEDESACNYTATYLQSGESYSIDIPRNYTTRLYHVTVLQTNDTNGFRIVFQDFYIRSTNQIQIGTGTDPSDPETVITTIYGTTYCCPWDVYIESNEMWIGVIGGLTYTILEIDADIVAFDLSTLFNCPRSNMNVSSDVLCDGVYHCDYYEDESACNYTTTYLQSGESYSIDIPRCYTRRFYHATVLQTNDTNGFRMVFQDFYIRSTNQVQIGTGTDPSDPQSVITSLFGYRSSSGDVYVETNQMWMAVIGGLYDTNLFIYVDIFAIDLSTLFNCPVSNNGLSVLCDGVYQCDFYEDESACNYTATYLQSGESYSIDIPRNYTTRLYHVTVLQTNDTNGFRIVFQDFYIRSTNQIQIGTGTDPSDPETVITTIYGTTYCCPWDVYIESNEMWIGVIGGLTYTILEIDADIVAFDLSTLFNCPRSNMNVSSDVLCDGVYHCDYYEDESACNYTTTYLQSGESYSIDIPRNYTRRFYHATVLQTNDTNGFRIVFQDFYIRSTNQIQIGTGTDPSDPQSVITSLFGSRSSSDDVYVETNQMWMAVIGGLYDTNLFIDVDIFAIDLSTLFNCPVSNNGLSVLCDGVYQCDFYEDESACNYTATYLQSGESHSIDIPRNYTRRFYHATVLQTNDTKGFRIVFQDFYIRSTNQVQIGTGTDPSDPESVITTIYGTTYCCPWDVYIESNEMWIGVIGGLTYTTLEIDADIVAFDLSTLFNCQRSNMNVSSDVLCDGVYHCDYYEDESACNYTTTYLQSGESHSIDIPRNYTRRFYHATVLQTNDTNGFRIVFQDFYIRSTNQIQIGTGTDPSDPQSVITSLFGYRSSSDDVYVETNQMWMAVIGGLYDTNLFIDVDIFAIDLSTLFNCPVSNNGLSVLCDGVYQCDFYEDESACNYTATYLQSGESHSIDIPRNYTRRFYHATVLQTNDTKGFRIVFQDFYIRSTNQVQIGTGTDPSDPESVITTIYGTTYCCPWDVYIESNEMWIAVIGGLTYTNLEIDADIVAFDLSTLFDCQRSNMNVSSDVLCDGVYHCDYYEDESACNYTTTYLQSGESYSIDIPLNYTRRFYHATVLQTNDTNGFRIVFQDFYIRSTNQVQIGTGTDPSDPESVITTIYGTTYCCPWDVYIESNEMWMAVIGGLYDTNLLIDVDIFAIDLSTLFSCPVSNINVSSDVLCDGVYHCDHYEDESACNYSTTYLQAGESHSISIPRNYTRRFYHATLLQTNDTNGFRIVFQDFYIRYTNQVQIGTGTDPSDPESVITTIYGTTYCCPWDVYIEYNKMWIGVIGGLTSTNLEIDADIIAFDLSTLFSCPVSNMNVSSDVLCDGVYNCDHYEDESACNYSTTYLQAGESHSISIPRNYTRRFYHATLLQTNDTNGFRIVFQDFYIRYTNQVQIGTGTDPSDPESVITTIYGTTHCCPWDVYIEYNKMWIGVIGGLTSTNLEIDADIIAFDLSTLFSCPVSNINVSSDVLCDGVYHCDHYEDESACNYSTTCLQAGESNSISIPRNYTRRFYHATVLQTNDTNGFRIVFQDLYLYSSNQIQIGRGTDPSDPQSVITTLFGSRSSSEDVYVATNKMWIAVIGGLADTNLFIDVDIFAIDLSTLFSCPVSNMNVSSDVLCDGVYHCDHYEDESACNYSTTYLQAGESHSISIPRNYTRRFYHATVLQTNDTNGFRIVFQDLYLYSSNQIQIGRGTDPSDPQSVITTLFGSRSSSEDVYVETNKMWIAVIGGLADTNLFIDVDIFAIDLSTLFSCPVSNMNVSSDVLCDGVYHCDHYEDESACNYSTTYLQAGESHSISIPRNYTRRLYHATVLQTNDTNGFRIVFQDIYMRSTNQIQIGKGTDPSDPQSVITTINGYRYCCPVDIYVEANGLWMYVIGGLTYTNIFIDVNIIAIDLRKSFHCPVSSRNISITLACDGYYDCDYFEDELYCNNPVTHLEEGQSHSISTPSFTREFYNTTLLKANTSNGFRIVFHRLYINSYDDEIRIGTGNDPSDLQTIVTTIHGYASYADNVYIDTHKMWVVVIGSQQYGHSSYIVLDMDVTVIDLLNSFPCSSSSMNVSVTLVCDGYYDCDSYEDESLCGERYNNITSHYY
ncbi:uncharacterized protein LOC129271812 [Lytechinus pictus]|uniref:uncharacterized protein LOC129271812 n=1 Tax=Lytechinus pictus TaxID=7653 RepID=UPI0030B9BF1A